MSEAIQDAISALEDERTVMDQKITAVRDAVMEQIDAAIDTLRGLAGGTNHTKTTKKPAKATKARQPRAAAAPADVGEKGPAILAALKKAGGCMKPGELSAAVKLEGYAFKAAVIALDDAGQVKRKGNGRGAVVMLPGYKPAKEAP